MRPHQTHPSLLRNIHPPIPKQGFLLPQSLVYVVLLRACDSGLVPVGWAVVAGQEQDLHGLGGGDGGPQARMQAPRDSMRGQIPFSELSTKSERSVGLMKNRRQP